ncbi:MAG: T9SS type A sorting domain-containing protein, partial [bacterium]|nr:T9SS type A sorting domain-containing protein [bacterium]
RTPSPESRTPTNGTPIAQSPLPITELLLPTSLGELRTALPSVYQVSANGTRNEIEASFQLTDKNTFGITLPNGYNPDHSLRIDPLIYSTFLGGSSGSEYGLSLVSDNIGGVFVSGSSNSVDFPITPGAYDSTMRNHPCFVTHLSSDGTQILSSTFIGGTGGEQPYGIANDGSGGVIIAGNTYSYDYPITLWAFDPTFNGMHTNCFVTRLNSSGSQLIYSTYLGGSNGTESQALALAGDGNGGAIITGYTGSNDFPSTQNAYDNTYNGAFDCFVTYLNNTGRGLLFSTFLGGSDDDVEAAIDRTNNGEIYLTGGTRSSNFPTTPNTYDSLFNGVRDCFLVKLNSTGSQLEYSTFVGGTGDDMGHGIAVDVDGIVAVTGGVRGNDFPTTTGAFDTSYNASISDCFLLKMNCTTSQLLASTFLGGNGLDQGESIVINPGNGSLVVVGETSSSNFPCSSNSIDTTFSGGTYDGFVSQFDSTLSTLLYSTYLGGASIDVACDIVYTGNDSIIAYGFTESSNFPTTTAAFDSTYNGGSDCFVTKLSLRADTSDVASEHLFLPLRFSLYQNYPNPFNSSTSISYSLPKPGNVDLRLFDITGREVATLVNQKQETGSYRVTFDGKNLSSGTYFVRMQAGEFVKTQKMVLLR